MTKREVCQKCHMLNTHCLCDCVQEKPSKINVIILQHQQEAKHHKNTIQLLKLNVTNCQIFVGNDDGFDLSAHEEFEHINASNSLLLYPAENSKILNPSVIKEDFPDNNIETLNLIVIDSSWKKSKKIFLSNAWLQQCKRYHLDLDKSASIYSIRKKRHEYFRSSLEATVLALNALEGYPIESSFELLQRFCELKEGDIQKYRK